MGKKYIVCSVIIALFVAVFLGIVMPKELHYTQENISININMRVDNDTEIKLYYLENLEEEYSESLCVSNEVDAGEEFQEVRFELPTPHIERIRIDCDTNVNFWDIQEIEIDLSGDSILLDAKDIDMFDKNDIPAIDASSESFITFKTGDADPFIVGTISAKTLVNKTINYLYLVVSFSFIGVLLILLMNKNIIVSMVEGIINTRRQIVSLAINDFKSRFTGSYLGIVWGIIQPLMTILLFWFVFQVGFRSAPISNAPFILWLVAGMIPWNFFSDAWINGTHSFTGYSYIVKKLVFNVDILPLIRILGSSVLNIIFNLLIVIIYSLYGRFPGVHLIDMVYFSICLILLAWGLSMITASLNVFIKDIGQFLNVIIQFVMWLTPIMWDYKILPSSLAWMYKFNPLFYIINGYREALIDGKWFFSNFYMMIWFWIVTIAVNIIGIRLMKKLRPHFADVL